MEELVKALDSELEYVRHELVGEMINIHVASTRKEPRCPCCGFASERVHSHYEKSLRGASFATTEALCGHIRKYIEAYNKTAKPFVWRKREVKGAQLKNNLPNLCN